MFLVVFIFLVLFANISIAQTDSIRVIVTDTSFLLPQVPQDSLVIQLGDSLYILDTIKGTEPPAVEGAIEPSPLPPDSVTIQLGDSIIIDTVSSGTTLKKKSAINSKVEYSATDSISLDLENQKVFLYREADIKYEAINQKAAYIEIDFSTSTLTALPRVDTTGKQYGSPEFSEGAQTFRSKEMRYNFKTRKGLIKNVITQEGEGYLHGEVVKKMDNDISNLYHGGYTTCNLDHPHYSIKFSKAKVIPNNKIVTGPAYMTIEDVPLPLILPFGLFPNRKGQTSGIRIPSYGESTERGFFLENGGYYWGINDYMELYLEGDIYSRGSWAVKPAFNYRKRYKYNGSFNFNYAINNEGIRETESFARKRDFRVTWSHRQDPKARPNSQFNASVNLSSATYSRYNPVSMADHFTNTYGSSISYATNLSQRVSLNTALRHTQNTTNKTVDLTLPEIALSVNRFYPLRKPDKTSNLQWYDNISVLYSMNAKNEVKTYDSLLFTPDMIKDFRNGVQHKATTSLSLKVLKYFSLNNSFDFTERWYSQSIHKTWINDSLFRNNDTLVGYVRTDTVSGFKSARDFGFSSTLNTSIYGMLQFKKGPVRAIRHVFKPTLSFAIRPDFGDPFYGYYRSVQSDTLGTIDRYSIFGGEGTFTSVFGTPQQGRSGRIGLTFSNNLEMKVRSKSDTVTGMKKIVLIESFTFGSGYDLAKDSLQWSPLTLSARTTLFKKLTIQYQALYDPYIKNEKGRSLNRFEWDENQRLFRRENSSWNFSLGYNFGSGQSKSARPAGQSVTVASDEEQVQEIIDHPDDYINWNNPWSFNFSYNLRYTDQRLYPSRAMQDNIVQTFNFNGDINITPKWKFTFASGYDFESNKLSNLNFNVYRDLHCWEMRFNWIPIGYLKSWNFHIKVKAQVLQDLKLNRKKDFRDN